jgi:hypothetical protein
VDLRIGPPTWIEIEAIARANEELLDRIDVALERRAAPPSTIGAPQESAYTPAPYQYSGVASWDFSIKSAERSAVP